MSKAVLTFAMYRGDHLVARESVADDVIKIGRDPNSHLVVEDEGASRMHAVVEVASPEEVTLIDLGNDPGTVVNGIVVNKSALSVGDNIQIGGTVIVLEAVQPAYTAPSTEGAAHVGGSAPMQPVAEVLAPVVSAAGAAPAQNLSHTIPFGSVQAPVFGHPAAAPPAFAPPAGPPAAAPPAFAPPAAAPPAFAPPAGPPAAAPPAFAPPAAAPAAAPPVYTAPAAAPRAAAPPVYTAPAAAPPAAAPPAFAPPATAPPAVASPTVNPFAGASAVSPFAAQSSNPFGAAPAAPRSVAQNAAPGTYTYELVRSGPDVSPDEVELPHVAAVEVMILWGDNTIHATHLTPPRNFYVGDQQGKGFDVDFFVPSEKLGTARMPVVIGDAANAAVVIPQSAQGTIEIAGQPVMSLDQARANSQPCSELAGAHQFPLPAGARARIQIADITFEVQTVNAGKPVPRGLASGFDWSAVTYFGLSALSIGSLMLAMAFFVPPLGLTNGEGIDQDQLILIQQYLEAAAEREEEEEETEQAPEDDADNKEGGTGTRAKGEEGSMGKEESKDTDKRYAVKGPEDNQDMHLARQAALREAAEFGLAGMLPSLLGGDANAPTAPWGRDTALGDAEMSAMGNMWGDEIGDAYGAGGLGLAGIGEGGGGRGEGIGLGSIGTLGHGAGTGRGQGFGSGHGRLAGSHKAKAPKVRAGATSVSGRLPKEVIQRIIRQNYGRFRMCYEKGLATNPNLQGRVAVRFVINSNGSVGSVANGGSSLPDASVVNCVVRAYYGLSFPKPEGGVVRVVYPISFSPG